MRVLITGGAGFIGSNLVRYLEERSVEVAVVENYCRGRVDNLAGTLADEHHRVGVGDVADFTEDDVCDVDAVVHAACLSITASVDMPVESFRVNALGTAAVAAACRDANIPMIHLSSVSVYGEDQMPPHGWFERHVDFAAMRGPYAAAKLAAELAVNAASADGLTATTLRLSNVYGPWQHHDDPHTGVVPRFLAAALEGRPLPIIGDGMQTRDFVHVHDVCRAIHMALEKPWHDCVNIGTGDETSIRDLATRVKVATNVEAIYIEERPQRPTDGVHRRRVDTTLAEFHGWEPTIELVAGLVDTAMWMRPRLAAVY